MIRDGRRGVGMVVLVNGEKAGVQVSFRSCAKL